MVWNTAKNVEKSSRWLQLNKSPKRSYKTHNINNLLIYFLHLDMTSKTLAEGTVIKHTKKVHQYQKITILSGWWLCPQELSHGPWIADPTLHQSRSLLQSHSRNLPEALVFWLQKYGIQEK